LDSYEPLHTEAAHFVECVLNGRTPKTDGHSGLRVVRALERAEASMIASGAVATWQGGPMLMGGGQLALASLLLDEMAGEPAA
jgi:hypothetical protein